MVAPDHKLQTIYESTLKRVQELEYLVDLSQNLTTSLNMDEVLERIANGVVTILQAFGCVIFLLENDGKTLTPRVVIDPDFKDEILKTPIHIDNSLTGKAIKARQGMVFNKAYFDDDGYQIPGTTADEEESVLSVPLIVDETVLGAMTVNRMGEEFSDNDLWLAEAFGRYAAIALKNAQVHQALQLSNERFHQLFENMSSGVVVYEASNDGQDFIIAGFNAAGERIGNVKREHIIGKSVLDVFPETKNGLFEVLQRVWRTGEPERFPLTYYENGNLLRWRNNYVYKLPTGEIVAVYDDVTEQKQAETALRESEERFRLVSELTSDYSFAYRVNADYSLENEWVTGALERISGYTAAELREKGGWDVLIHPEDRAVPLRQFKSLLQSKPNVVEYRIITKNGGIRWMRDYARPQWDEAEQRVVRIFGAVQDITAQKEAEIALQESEARLQQAQKMESIGTLAGGIAHDFNNLLTAINGQAELGLMKLPEEHPARKNLVGILSAGNRAAKLTGQLLAFSRRQMYRPQAVGINRHIQELLDMLRHLIREDITIETKLAPDVPPINADPHQLEQILVNLVVNARDAIYAQADPARGKTITIQTEKLTLDEAFAATHPDAAPGEYLSLSVTDTGIGMDEDVREKIFEPFFTTKPKGRGTGLGLATVYGIVKQNGGSIYVYSRKGLGTTFKILWPLPEKVDTPEHTETNETAPVLTGTETILLAEDDEQVRAFAADSLRALGYNLLVAENGAHALQQIAENQQPIDLLVTDVIMPEIDGPKLAETLRQRLPKLPVLFMSGYTDNLLGKRGALSKHVHFLQKPFSTHRLAEKVRTILDEIGVEAQENQ